MEVRKDPGPCCILVFFGNCTRSIRLCHKQFVISAVVCPPTRAGLDAVEGVPSAAALGTIPGPVIQLATRGPGVYVRVTDLGGSKDCVVSRIIFEVLGPDQKPETFGLSSDSVHPSRLIDLQHGKEEGLYSVRAFGECDSTRTDYSSTLGWGGNVDARSWTNFKAPINVRQVDINSTTGISLSWEEPEGGPQAEYYSARCFLSTDPDFISPVYCAASNPVASVDKIPPKTGLATLTNLKPSTLYKCFVVAMDEDHWVCSDPVLVDYQSYGTCDPDTVNDEQSDARLVTCRTHKRTVQDVQGGRTAQLRAYGLEIVDMSGTTIQRKIESFPGATIPIHFKFCISNSSKASEIDDAIISQQIEVMNQAFAQAKITFTKGQTDFCAEEDTKKLATKCDVDLENLLENQQVLDYLDENDLSATEENAIDAASDICATSAFSVTAVTDLAGGITSIIMSTELFLGVSSTIGLYNVSAPPLLLIGYDTLPDVLPNSEYDLGMTMPHEMGHKLGLLHPWEEALDPENYEDMTEEIPDLCLEERDPMPSTPFTNDAIFDCKVGSDTCLTKPGRDPINNIMSYSNDCCLSVFNMEQIVLIQANILTFAPFWLNT